ncbi:ExbD/TolR family protein [Ectothiorhodospira lacustris]|uniref:ExbD/TolR family protein n=1 Tax=Ectothiorhodospira lacustris TaxID=2899127 RepID=UPI001EE833AB|nr:biopolymer transporter ExbD [Ectothiorhodospira lacustris]MCG5509470.1 biopolymer transporter ExbD [Ectothiorhodospira lacustris]MCG5521524.1 biopolymer transporter ExbD [Ectothiorhodospira lacustris]
MHIEAPAPRRRALISLTPLIDVVFILLIFFMLASSFLDWSAVTLSTPSPQSSATDDQPPLAVRILPGGELRVAGEAVTGEHLVSVLREHLTQEPSRMVVVQPAGEVPLQTVVNVLDRVREAEPVSLRLSRE